MGSALGPSTKLLLRFLLGGELNTLGDVLLELVDAGGLELLLVGGEGTDGVDLLNAVLAKLDAGAEEANLGLDIGLNEGALNDALVTTNGLEEGEAELRTSVRHGESGRASAVLGLDDLITSVLDTLGEGLDLFFGELETGLAEERHDGGTRVSTDNVHIDVEGVEATDASDEGLGADDVEGGDTEEAGGVEGAGLLEDLSGDGDGAVDGVGDDQDVGLGAGLGDSSGEITDDGSVCVEQIVTGHAGLAGHTSGNDDDIGAVEGLAEVLLGVALDHGRGGDVAEVSGDTSGVANVVQGKGGNDGVALEKEGEGLADATSGTEDGNLGGAHGGASEHFLAQELQQTKKRDIATRRINNRKQHPLQTRQTLMALAVLRTV